LVVATLTGEGRWGLPGVNNTNSQSIQPNPSPS
jgi:hypothetical protein